MAGAATMRTEHVATSPRGWKVRTIAPGPDSKHEVRIAFPPGRRKKGSGRVVEILHPAGEKNPKCALSEKARKNPGELLIFGNPSTAAKKRTTRDRASRIRAARLNPKARYGKVFTERGTKYVKFDGGAILLTHAIERAKELGDKKTVARLEKHLSNPKKKNLRPRRNPSEEEQAVRLFQGFHGHDPKEIVEKHVSAATRLDYTALGDLVYLKVETPVGKKAEFNFHGDGVKLAISPDGKQLYCIGGNQNILPCLDEDSKQKDFIDLGDAIEVAYLARKIHGKFQPVEYYHEFGEVDGTLPRLMYDRLRKQIFFIGGNYWVDVNMPAPGTPLGKISPGIEN